MIARFLQDQRGITAIEYAMLAGVIMVAIVTALGAIGQSLTTDFNNVAAGFK